MGVATSEVGYAPAMPRREDHEVHKGHVVALGGRGTISELKSGLEGLILHRSVLGAVGKKDLLFPNLTFVGPCIVILFL